MFYRARVEPPGDCGMAGHNGDPIGVVACQVRVDEDEETRDSAGEWEHVLEQRPRDRIRVKDDDEQ